MLIRYHTPQSPFNVMYEPSYRIIKKIGDKSFDVQYPTGKVKKGFCKAPTIHVPCGILCGSTPTNGNVWENCIVH